MPMPDEPWRSRLQPASFRGVGFKVDLSSFVGGRRTVTHEYPKRDLPSAEDMGRRARRYSLAAYIVGGDYDRQRDQLIQALEAEGPGTLVHPYLGQYQANVEQPFNIVERRDRGRMCEIEVTFVESGEAASMAPGQDNAARVGPAAATADSVALFAVNADLATQGGIGRA